MTTKEDKKGGRVRRDGGRLVRVPDGESSPLTTRIDPQSGKIGGVPIDPALTARLDPVSLQSSSSGAPSDLAILTMRIDPAGGAPPLDTSKMSPEERKAYEETMELMAKLRSNIQEITNGASVDPDLAQLTAPILSAKGVLTNSDLLNARIGDPETAKLLMARIVPERGGLASYITGRALQDELVAGTIPRDRVGSLGRFREMVIRETTERLQSTLGVAFRGDSLHPGLLDAMARNPKIADYVTHTFAAAKREGIDPYLLANQFWKESNYNPNAVSNKGAVGVAQFMPEHIGKWGIRTREDLRDPFKSIDAGAWHMRHLTQMFGNQVLALAAYNGGPDAVYTANRALGAQNVSVSDWLDVMEYRRRQQGTGTASAWHVETYDYIKKITEWSGIDARAFEATQSVLAQSTRLAPADSPKLQPR